jgi:succinoglycan biosynthesis protein ExoO
MTPKVSVVIPAYNTERYIATAVRSALEKTERDIEVVVVDDCSTDATGEVVKGFADRRVKLWCPYKPTDLAPYQPCLSR